MYKLLRTTMLASVVAFCAHAGATYANAETLRVSLFTPPSHTFNHALEAWGKELTEKSGGELKFEFFPAGQLAPPPRQFDLLRSGGADITVVLQAATPGRFPMSELAGLPLVQPSAGSTSAIMSRRYTELAPEYLASEYPDAKILWMAVSPPLRIVLSKTKPATLDAFKGLRIRYAGTVAQKLIEAMGATPVPVPPAESADAMSKGVVDGAMFPFEAVQSFDLAPVSKYATDPGLSSATFSFLISQAAYSRLSPEMQKLVDENSGPDRGEWFGALWDAGEEKARQYVINGGVEIVTLPASEMAKLAEAYSGISKESIDAAGGDTARAFIDAYVK